MNERTNKHYFCCSIFLLNAGGRRLQLWRDPARSLHTAHAETLLLLMMSWKASQIKGHGGRRGGVGSIFFSTAVGRTLRKPSFRPPAPRCAADSQRASRRSCGERRPSFARLIKLDVKRSYGTRLLFLVLPLFSVRRKIYVRSCFV